MEIYIEKIDNLVKDLKLDEYTKVTTKLIHVSKLYLCRLLQIVAEIKILLTQKTYNTILILLRATFDIVIDLKNINTDPKYIDRIALKYIKNKRDQIDGKRHSRQLSKEEEKSKNLFEQLESDYTDNGIKVIREGKKYNILNDSKVFYNTVYSVLSDEIHGNIGYLSDTLSELKDEQIRYKVYGNTIGFSIDKLTAMINVNILESIIIIKKINGMEFSKDEEELKMIYFKMLKRK